MFEICPQNRRIAKPCFDDFLNKNYLSKDDHKYLKPCGSKPGIMYGLCKIHKCTTVNDPVPSFRPILSASGTYNYNLAKFLYQSLNSLLLWNTQSKTFFHFVKKFLAKTQIYL